MYTWSQFYLLGSELISLLFIHDTIFQFSRGNFHQISSILLAVFFAYKFFLRSQFSPYLLTNVHLDAFPVCRSKFEHAEKHQQTSALLNISDSFGWASLEHTPKLVYTSKRWHTGCTLTVLGRIGKTLRLNHTQYTQHCSHCLVLRFVDLRNVWYINKINQHCYNARKCAESGENQNESRFARPGNGK